MTFSPTWNSTVASLSQGLRGAPAGGSRRRVMNGFYQPHATAAIGPAPGRAKPLQELPLAPRGEGTDAGVDVRVVVVEVGRDAQPFRLERDLHAALGQEGVRARRVRDPDQGLAGAVLPAGGQHLEGLGNE